MHLINAIDLARQGEADCRQIPKAVKRMQRNRRLPLLTSFIAAC
jgi:hypothetical protein